MGDIPNRQASEPQADRPRIGRGWVEFNGPSILVWGTVCILVMASTGLFVRLWRQQRSDRSASMTTTADSEGKSNGLVEEQAVMEKDANLRVVLRSDLKMLKDELKMAKEYFEGQAVMEKDANLRVQFLSDLKKLKDELKMAKEYHEQLRKELEEVKRSANALLVALQQKRG